MLHRLQGVELPDAQDRLLHMLSAVCACRAAGSQVDELNTAQIELTGRVEQLTSEKDALLPQLEQARWQNRQLEKQLEQVTAAQQLAEQVGRIQVYLLIHWLVACDNTLVHIRVLCWLCLVCRISSRAGTCIDLPSALQRICWSCECSADC